MSTTPSTLEADAATSASEPTQTGPTLEEITHHVMAVLPELNEDDVADAAAFIDRIDREMIGRYCGSLSDKLANLLPALVAARRFDDQEDAVHLEIGTLFGGSLLGRLWTLHRAGRQRQRIFAIDPLDGYYGQHTDPHSGLEITEHNVLRNIERFGFDPDRVTLVKRFSTDPACLERLADARLITLLIDGDHSYQGAADDWHNFAPRIAAGGMVILDDFGNPWWPEVTRFGRELADSTPPSWRVRGTIDTGLILEREQVRFR